jgi:deoxyribodipyrimidine photolyase
MHNRVRMITSGSFLVKDLLIDWGEAYSAEKLFGLRPERKQRRLWAPAGV